MTNKKFTIVLSTVMAVMLIFCIILTTAFNYYAQVMNQVFGSAKYTTMESEDIKEWDADYYDKGDLTLEVAEAQALSMSEEISQEGNVLLKNNGILPLDSSDINTVSTFGWSFYHPVYGETESGSVNTETAITPQKSLENSGITVSAELVSYYIKWSEDNEYIERPSVGMGGNDWQVSEVAFSDEEVK